MMQRVHHGLWPLVGPRGDAHRSLLAEWQDAGSATNAGGPHGWQQHAHTGDHQSQGHEVPPERAHGTFIAGWGENRAGAPQWWRPHVNSWVLSIRGVR